MSYCGAVLKSTEKNQNLLMLRKSNGHFMRRPTHVLLLQVTLNHHQSVLFKRNVIRCL